MNNTEDSKITDLESSAWLKLSLQIPAHIAEPAVDLMGILSNSAVEERPEQNGQIQINGFFALNAQEEEARKGEINEIEERAREEFTNLYALYNISFPQAHAFDSALMDNQDWATSWMEFFKPFEIIPNLFIKPSWEEFTPEDGQQVIAIDPGQAFGTGQHASTQMALALMQGCFDGKNAPETVLDVGTGTGILAIAASLFGAQEIVAIDNDPLAVEAAQENIALNPLSHLPLTSTQPLAEVSGRFQLISANIVHDVLVEMAEDISAKLADQGYVVLAGILKGEQEKNIISIYEQLGFHLLQSRYTKESEEWVALLFYRG